MSVWRDLKLSRFSDTGGSWKASRTRRNAVHAYLDPDGPKAMDERRSGCARIADAWEAVWTLHAARRGQPHTPFRPPTPPVWKGSGVQGRGRVVPYRRTRPAAT